MTDAARTEILSRLQAGIKQNFANQTIETAEDSLRPYSWTVKEDNLLTYFNEKITLSGATYSNVGDRVNLPQHVAQYIKKEELKKNIRISNPALKELNWLDQDIAINYGVADSKDELSLVQAFAGIAETGTLVCVSDISVSTLGLYLPPVCMIVVNKEMIVNSLEDAWLLLEYRNSAMPRTVNLVTGPSRTGDIEQTIQIGAHGPLKLHIFIINT